MLLGRQWPQRAAVRHHSRFIKAILSLLNRRCSQLRCCCATCARICSSSTAPLMAKLAVIRVQTCRAKRTVFVSNQSTVANMCVVLCQLQFCDNPVTVHSAAESSSGSTYLFLLPSNTTAVPTTTPTNAPTMSNAPTTSAPSMASVHQ